MGLTITGSGQTYVSNTAARKSVLGQALTVLASSDPYLIDEANSVDVQLIDPVQWLMSCDDAALADGVNLAVLGGELVQFGQVTALGQGRFRLSRLLRGRAGTEWAAGEHVAGDPFCLIDSNSLQSMTLPIWLRGTALNVADRKDSTASLTFGAESVRPLTPCNLSAHFNTYGDLEVAWTRRSRSLVWLDEIDAPIGESREHYSVTVATAADELVLSAEGPERLVTAGALAPLGTGAATIQVRQIGDWAASRPASVIIKIA